MTRWRGFVWRARTVLAALLIPPLVHVVPIDRLARALARRSAGSGATPTDERMSEWVDMVLYRLPWPWRRTCLKRAAVLFYLLVVAGRPASIKVGVRKSDGQSLEAHAWLERGSDVILEPASSNFRSFRPITTLP